MSNGDYPIFALGPMLALNDSGDYIQTSDWIIFNVSIDAGAYIETWNMRYESSLDTEGGYYGIADAQIGDYDGAIRTIDISGRFNGSSDDINLFIDLMGTLHCGEQSARGPYYFLQRYTNQSPCDSRYRNGVRLPGVIPKNQPSGWNESRVGVCAKVLCGSFDVTGNPGTNTIEWKASLTEGEYY